MKKIAIKSWDELPDRSPQQAVVANVDLVVIRYDDQVSVQITYTIVTNTPPTVTITAPADASGYNEGDNITFTGCGPGAMKGPMKGATISAPAPIRSTGRAARTR